ncbi:hypothetical protein PPROV_000363300 [Pycnococcus provasolii]|uniref:EF-hand domain-containing protein n=1 Tax=Pycnococcus provasolii TaxID=41880 RepID=A0A830HGW7_9CHLO|nr:hypothetical protein PPROV_000363300 [Pycnococcus provasolii]
MSSRYQKAFTIPDGFPQVLKNFAREVLRTQCDNIYEFGARYFSELVEARNAELEAQRRASERSITELSATELEEFILEVFLEADEDGNGILDRREMKKVLSSSTFNFKKKQIRSIMAECDENDDGVIEYREFVPLMVGLVQAMKAKEDAEAAKEEEEEEARAEAEEYLLRGMSREQLEQMMANVFRAADSDGSGYLDRSEFRNCLKSAELGLTKKDINMLMAEVDIDGDGKITYDEFVPLCFNVLVERFKDNIIQDRAYNSTDGLESLLVDAFGDGFASIKELRSCLEDLSYEILGLTNMQIFSIMSMAEKNDDNLVDCLKFAKAAANMIYSMIDNEAQSKRMEAIRAMSESDAAHLMRGLSQESVKEIMAFAFEQADADKSGYLDRAEMMTCLESLGSTDLALRPHEIRAIANAIDENEDGRVSYKELLDFMLDILMHIEREAYVQEVAFENEMMKYGYMYGYEGEFDEARTDEPPPAEPINPAYEAAQEGTFDATMI